MDWTRWTGLEGRTDGGQLLRCRSGVAVDGPFQTVMSAQRGGRVLGAEQTAFLQDRHHLVNKNFQAGRQDRGHDVEAVSRAGMEPLLDGISTFVFATTMALISLGIMLSVILPTTPFMLWVMGMAGLLVLVIESLVASVLWAVMLMHPSGEGVTSDQSRQGLMILLNLFMRPSLMLMGMVSGIFMVDPLVTYVNDMFFFVFKSTQANSYTMLFITFGFISVYCTLVLSIIKKTFSMIHVIPDTVLAWIGGNPHNLGMTDAADKGEQMAGTAAQRFGEGAKAMGGSAEQAAARRDAVKAQQSKKNGPQSQA